MDGSRMNVEEADAIVQKIEDALASFRPRAPGIAIEVDGVSLFHVSARALRCEGCGLVVPQPLTLTRQSPVARAQWIRDHIRCASHE
jgi:hypothetical protein